MSPQRRLDDLREQYDCSIARMRFWGTALLLAFIIFLGLRHFSQDLDESIWKALLHVSFSILLTVGGPVGVLLLLSAWILWSERRMTLREAAERQQAADADGKETGQGATPEREPFDELIEGCDRGIERARTLGKLSILVFLIALGLLFAVQGLAHGPLREFALPIVMVLVIAGGPGTVVIFSYAWVLSSRKSEARKILAQRDHANRTEGNAIAGSRTRPK